MRTKPTDFAFQLAVVAMLAFVLGLGGCSLFTTGAVPLLTPNEDYLVDQVAFTVAQGYIESHGVPSPTVLADEAAVQQDLNDAQTWLTNNPTLADTPGAACPPLALVNIAMSIVNADKAGLSNAPATVALRSRHLAMKAKH